MTRWMSHIPVGAAEHSQRRDWGALVCDTSFIEYVQVSGHDVLENFFVGQILAYTEIVAGLLSVLNGRGFTLTLVTLMMGRKCVRLLRSHH